MKSLSTLAIVSVLVYTKFGFGQEIEKVYTIEAFQRDGDTRTLILKFKPYEAAKDSLLPRQEEDEDDGPSPTPFIPPIIPGVTKIFNGILSGNLNEIFHGATSFAPKNTSYAIDTVYNQVVGLPPPKTAAPSTKAPVLANATVESVVESVVETTPETTPEDEDEDGESDLFGGFLRAKKNNSQHKIVKKLLF